jgi:crotonobetainyl-CoA:carnitine CoA-transferase CaiB-like acyl-CoA transferase
MPQPLPLAGLRVLDLSRILAGPTCTQMLGDLGADVLKIERPGEGDDTRRWGPPFLQDADGRDTGESAYYLAVNRNKRSVAIDIAHPEGRALIRRLLADCDLLVENFKVGGLKKHGLAYADLRADFPGLVYCSITGFGQTGPYAPRAGYDYLAQGAGGIMSLTGEPGGPPLKVGVAIADIMCGMYASVAVLAALRHRDATGEGQEIDLALLDTQIAWLANQASAYLVSGRVPGRLGNEHPTIVPYRVFQTQDGWVILAVGNDGQFRKWCAFAGLPELAADPRFATNAGRVVDRAALSALMEPAMRQRTTTEWVDGLSAAGVPCGPVNDLAQVFEDPQVLARQLRIDMAHPLAAGGSVPMVANPIRMSRTPPAYRAAPPTLGQHTAEVLRERLGLDDAELDRLRRAGAIG